jgi:hypothetical protein
LHKTQISNVVLIIAVHTWHIFVPFASCTSSFLNSPSPSMSMFKEIFLFDNSTCYSCIVITLQPAILVLVIALQPAILVLVITI